MNKIQLRAYTREIEEAIDQKQTDEAIAHCRHILKTYPKHIETYRLLGRAYLESQRYGSAADLFQRVLSSIPNDFISHVGMSIIREDEGNLDAAIWHMERAFEAQPYNAAIQGELRRLYGRRDGIEPPKIRLTRGALAHMYARGNLYDQAIAELRATLASDPQRADLQVMLAEMYVKSGKRTEAIETCSSLLQRLPYCLEANRLLAQLLPESERTEDMKTYRQRLQALDPYEAFISPKTPTAEDVPDQAVTITRLDWDGGPAVPQTSDQPEWATSIDANIGDSDSDEEDLPDWFSSSPEEVPAFDFDHKESLADEESDIPDWMQEAGWEPPNGEIDESAPSFASDEEDLETEGAVVGDIPDWLREMAPSDVLQESEEKAPSITPEDIEQAFPSWLDEEADGATDSIITWLDENDKTKIRAKDALPGEEPAGGTPEWLQDLDAAAEATDAAAAVVVPASKASKPESGDEEVPDWLQDLVGKETSPEIPVAHHAEVETSDIPDWLKEMAEEAPAGEAPPFPIKKEQPKADVPDWLQGLGDETSEIEAQFKASVSTQPEIPQAESQPEALGPSHAEVEPTDIPEWLKDIAAEAPAEETTPVPVEMEQPETPVPSHAEVPVPSRAEPELADIPDWLQELVPKPPAEKTQPALSEEIRPEVEAGKVSAEEGVVSPELDDSDAAMAWLESLAAKQGVPEEELLTRPEDRTGTPPDWVQVTAAEAEPISELHEEILAPTAEDNLPEWLADLDKKKTLKAETVEAPVTEAPPTEKVTPEVDFSDADAAMAWLEGLAAKQGVSEEELITSPEERAKTPPYWVQAAVEAAVAEPVMEAELEKPEMEDIPDWLRDTIATETPSEELPMPQQEPATIVAETAQEEQLPPTAEVESAEPEAAETIAEGPKPEEETILEDVPEWLRQAIEAEKPQEDGTLPTMEAEAAEPETAEIPIEGVEAEEAAIPEDISEWLRQAMEAEASQEAATAPTTEVEAAEPEAEEILTELEPTAEEVEEPLITPLTEAAKPPEIQAEASQVPVEETKGPAPEAEAEIGPPAWVHDGEELEEEGYTWVPTEATAEIEERLELNKASMIQLERLTALGFRRAQSIVTYRDKHGNFSKLEDLLNVPGIDAETVEAIKSQVTVTALPEPAAPPETVSPKAVPQVEPEDEFHARQIEAQTKLAQGNVDCALVQYGKLIKKGKRLDGVIADLNQAVYDFPTDVCVNILQTLGDAYMKADKLQDALDAYTKAEELLR